MIATPMGVCLAPPRCAVTASAPANEQSLCSAAGGLTVRFASRAWSTNTRVHETCTSACGAATVARDCAQRVVHVCLCLCALRARVLCVPAPASVSVSVLQQLRTADSSHGTSGYMSTAMELQGHHMLLAPPPPPSFSFSRSLPLSLSLFLALSLSLCLSLSLSGANLGEKTEVGIDSEHVDREQKAQVMAWEVKRVNPQVHIPVVCYPCLCSSKTPLQHVHGDGRL